jgi:hypothetical protein
MQISKPFEIVGEGVEKEALDHLGSGIGRVGGAGAETGYPQLVPQDRLHIMVYESDELFQAVDAGFELGQVPVVD